MKIQRVISIVAGGEQAKIFLSHIANSDMVIGVDGGTLWLLKNGIVPHAAVGDFDSVSKKQLATIKKIVKKVTVYPAKKEATDLELAVRQAIALAPAKVVIYGALGKRFDHAYGAVQLLTTLTSHNILGEIVDNFNKLIVSGGTLRLAPDRRYRYVSVVPLGASATVSLDGFVYDGTGLALSSGSTLGISNEIMADVGVITVHKGQALVIQSRD